MNLQAFQIEWSIAKFCRLIARVILYIIVLCSELRWFMLKFIINYLDCPLTLIGSHSFESMILQVGGVCVFVFIFIFFIYACTYLWILSLLCTYYCVISRLLTSVGSHLMHSVGDLPGQRRIDCSLRLTIRSDCVHLGYLRAIRVGLWSAPTLADFWLFVARCVWFSLVSPMSRWPGVWLAFLFRGGLLAGMARDAGSPSFSRLWLAWLLSA